MNETSRQKCEVLLANGDLTTGRKKLVENVARQIELNDQLYPTVRQREILDGLYRSYVRANESQAERDAREFMGN